LPGAMAPSAAPAPAAQAPITAPPAYADPRLNRSGEVRDEFRKSGEWIR